MNNYSKVSSASCCDRHGAGRGNGAVRGAVGVPGGGFPRQARRSPLPVRAGLTLLEVILAIAILGGSLAVLGELARVGTRSARAARTLSSAQLLADSLMAEICAGAAMPESTEGLVPDYGGAEWSYRVEVEPMDQQGLLAVLITVQENVDPSQRPTSYSLLRWMIDPQVEYDLEAAEADMEAQSSSDSSSTQDAGSSDSGSSGGSGAPAGGSSPAGGSPSGGLPTGGLPTGGLPTGGLPTGGPPR